MTVKLIEYKPEHPGTKITIEWLYRELNRISTLLYQMNKTIEDLDARITALGG